MEITKEKNFINFEVEENKKYRININTGEFIGVKGQPIKTIPKVINDYFYNEAKTDLKWEKVKDKYVILALLRHITPCNQWSNPNRLTTETIKTLQETMQMLDVLQSVGFVPDIIEGRISDLIPSHLCGFKNFKPHAFLKWAEEKRKERETITFKSISDFLKEQENKLIEKLFNAKNEREQKIVQFLINNVTNRISLSELESQLDYYTLLFKLLSQDKFYEAKKGEELISLYNSSSLSFIKIVAKNIQKICKDWNLPLPTKNVYRFYTDNIGSYLLWLDEKKEEKFKENQLKKDLSFTYGKFTVVIPTKTMDLVEEGKKMHHCVGNGSYAEGVARGDYNIVFIRKTNNIDTPYITAQIYKNGTFGGYYLAWDTYITSDEDREFKREYSIYLQNYVFSNDN